jgi:hypothetical protein
MAITSLFRIRKSAPVIAVLGILTTVGVAWYCGISIDVYGQRRERLLGFSNDSLSCWWLFDARAFGSYALAGISIHNDQQRNRLAKICSSHVNPYDLPSWAAFGESPTVSGIANPQLLRVYLARGWPCLALESELCFVWEGDVATSGPVVTGGINLGPFRGGAAASYRALSLRPIWFGLIVNAILFAVMWSVLWVIARALLLQLRRRSGHCPSCAYDLRGTLSGRCPECGHILAGQ